MIRISTLSMLLVACVMPTPALALDAKVQSAIPVVSATVDDPAKLETFCEMSDAMDAAGDNEDSATEAKIDGYLAQLGSDFEEAWDVWFAYGPPETLGAYEDAAKDRRVALRQHFP